MAHAVSSRLDAVALVDRTIGKVNEPAESQAAARAILRAVLTLLGVALAVVCVATYDSTSSALFADVIGPALIGGLGVSLLLGGLATWASADERRWQEYGVVCEITEALIDRCGKQVAIDWLVARPSHPYDSHGARWRQQGRTRAVVGGLAAANEQTGLPDPARRHRDRWDKRTDKAAELLEDLKAVAGTVPADTPTGEQFKRIVRQAEQLAVDARVAAVRAHADAHTPGNPAAEDLERLIDALACAGSDVAEIVGRRSAGSADALRIQSRALADAHVEVEQTDQRARG